MIMSRTIIIIIIDLIIVLVLIFTALTCFGCRLVMPIVDAIFQPPASNDIIDSGKESLFDAVKGSNWLVTFSILGMAAGVFAFINGSKIGIPVVVSCGAALFLSLAVARFALWMAIFGFIGAVAAVAVSILVKQRALKEVVGNVQDIKGIAANGGGKKEICKDIKDTLSKQTSTTKKLVRKIKEKLKFEEK